MARHRAGWFVALTLVVAMGARFDPARGQEGPESGTPIGFAGKKAPERGAPGADDFVPIEDRWRIGFPDWDRYAHGRRPAAPYTRGRWYDPYRQNVLKGDYPILGNATFLNLTLLLDTLGDARRLPTPSGASAEEPGSEEFFGGHDELAAASTLILSLDLFHGAAAFRPVDWRVRATPAANVNFLRAEERGIVDIDVRSGTDRTDRHAGLQEGFLEVKLLDVSPTYDIVSLRAGVQGFLSDFRGFLFADNEPGVRLFGNWAANRSSWNLAWFRMFEKDTNSALNTGNLDSRHQEVFIANLFRQDFLFPGYTAGLSIHVNHDDPSTHFDENGFLVRPAAVGSLQPHAIDARYYGWTGSGHIDRLNLTHALYIARGDDSENPIAARAVTIDAWMGALELSFDKDWMRYRGQIFFASGDRDATDGRAEGFDVIFDNPLFAGGGTSFWVRQGIGLSGTKVKLVGPSSLLPSLRSSKEEGQANFVNPGLRLVGLGADAEFTPKTRGTANVNLIWFDRTSSLETLLFQSGIERFVGTDLGIGMQWRPWLNNNVILTGTASTLLPGKGFEAIYTGSRLFSITGSLTVVF